MKAYLLVLTIALLFCKLLGAPFSESTAAPWGKDSDLCAMKKQPVETKKRSIGQMSCVAMIRFFQDKISPIDGPRSSFYPTSSQYALEAIKEWGVFRGIALGCDRLMRENSEEWVYPTIVKYDTLRKYDPIVKNTR